jgi:hypothetical protein
MRRRNTTFYAGLVILFGLWISTSSSETYAQGNKTSDLSNYSVQDYIRSRGFISSRPIPYLGTIAGSAAAQVNLSQGDLIYIRLEAGTQVKAGDRFYMAHWGREIIHPKTQEKMGHLVRISGVAVILDGSGQIVPARIAESFYQVRYGDLIISPAAGTPAVLPTRFPEKIKGMIVASPEEEENITERLAVYIDRGAQDGVMVGDLFGIYQMPYYTEEIRESNRNLPLLEVGEGVVVFANAENSTMLITKSFQAIYIGDRIVSVRKR